MTETTDPIYGGIEVWRGSVNAWECDQMAHMNVRFYVAKAMEGLVGLADALGLHGAFSSHANATLLVKDQHIRFLREARVGAPLHMMAGVLAMSDDEARIFQLLIHSGTGELAASFQTVVQHVTARDERPFAWSTDARARAAELVMTVPERAAPRSLPIDAPLGIASKSDAERLGLARLSAGAFGMPDLDVFGRMRPELFIGRLSDGVPGMALAFRGGGEAVDRPANVGGAVIEYRLAHRTWPRAGDRFEVRSGLADVDGRTQKLVHWMLDPVSGKAWGTAEAIAVALDLDARKMIPNSEADQARLRARITPGLTL